MSKGTPIRAVRVPDDVWQRAKERALKDNTTVSDLLQRVLAAYGDDAMSVDLGPQD